MASMRKRPKEEKTKELWTNKKTRIINLEINVSFIVDNKICKYKKKIITFLKCVGNIICNIPFVYENFPFVNKIII